MKKIFMVKGTTTPEEYLKNMLDSIDENGELNVARESDDVTFCTAETEEDASHIEKAKVDVNLVDYDKLYAYYLKAIAGITNGSFVAELPCDEKLGKYGKRMSVFAKRIGRLIGLQAPAIIIQTEKCMLIDSIVLYKTNAVGDLYENER